ncbi:NAD(P)-binding domain-containing protein [Acuticoccus sediminis]|uniref:NAD(P)-binding domain-containing protein n=1 Tax=Acuticoccus sediminis TaxID=2184697 RepID=UPI001CFC59AB|nr:NAD(P)/FAD-dependent oxidoreductase [Acuticoccus sediminis]
MTNHATADPGSGDPRREDGPVGLDRHTAELRRDLSFINYPPENWLPARPGELDVLVVGGGQMGLAASFALNKAGIRNHAVIDAAPAGLEGPWVTYARMKTLRSPNHLVGPAQDIPALTFRAYHEALYGSAAWASLGKIPRGMWQDYLVWFREALELPVENGCALTAIAPTETGVEVAVTRGGAAQRIRARRLVLATGRDGLGGPAMPGWVPAGDARFQHTVEAIDFEALAGRDVAVIGASASAFDNAATALEAGAGSVHMLMRRPKLATYNRFKTMVHAGFTFGMPALPPAERLALLNAAFEVAVAPPADSVARIAHDRRFHFHPGTSVCGVDASGSRIVLDLGGERLTVDKVILGTGFKVDLGGRPELAALDGHVVLMSDLDLPPEVVGQFARHPDVCDDFTFRPRLEGDAWVSRVHSFNIAAMASLGLISGDIPGVGDGARRLAEGIARNFFLEDYDAQMARITGYSEVEIQGDELDARVAPGTPTVTA